MPTYDYKCVNVGCFNYNKIDTRTHGMNEGPPSCLVCKGPYVVHHGSPPPVIYKGKFFKNSGGY